MGWSGDHAAENFFQGGSPKQATPFPRQDLLTARNRFTPNFRGWGLDENLKPKSPSYRGAHIEVRRQDKMRLASRLVPPPHAAHPPQTRHTPFAEREVMEYWIGTAASVQLDV